MRGQQESEKSDRPFISIEAIEVNRAGTVFAASKIVLEHRAEGGDVSCSVADRDLAVVFGCEMSVSMAGEVLTEE